MPPIPDAKVAVLVLTAFFALLALAPGAAAQRIAAGPGVEVRFEGGALVASRDGKDVWRQPVRGTASSGEARLEARELAGGRFAVHVATADVEAVAEVGPGGRDFTLVWEGSTELRGDPGERTAAGVELADLTGDGKPEIIVGTRSEQVRLCGVDGLPLLFRRVWDPAGRKLRPVTASRPGLATADLREIAVGADDGSAGPVFPILVPAAVSSSAGDRGDALLLSPPAALLDGDPATAWIPGSGNGAGEFATFSAAAATWGLTRIGLRLLPAGRKAAARGRPVSVLLAAQDRVLRLVLPEGRPGAGDTFWFDLPEPLKTTCLSLVLEGVAGRGGRPPALAEVIAFTEIDGPGGLSRLARELDGEERGDAAAALLPRAGAAALDPIAAAWKDLGLAGRRRAVRAVVEIATSSRSTSAAVLPVAAGILAEAALSGDEAAARAAEAGLARTGAAAVAALSPALSDADDERFFRAASLLAVLDRDEALEALAAAAGAGRRDRREQLRRLLVHVAASGEERVALLLGLLERARDAGERERMIDLARAAARVAAATARLADLALPEYDAAAGFADRYRLLEVVSSLRDGRALPRLLAAAGDGDHLLRAAAVRGLAFHGAAPETPAALDRALADAAPEVRIAALEAFGRLGDAGNAAHGIADLVRADPWPRVRSAAAILIPSLPGDLKVAAAVAAIGDPSPAVREAGLRVASGMPAGAEVDAAIDAVLADGNLGAPLLSKAAAAAGLRCQASAVRGLRALLERGAEPLAPPERVDAARAAARALGAIGGPETRTALEQVRQRSNPAVARAIDEALGSLGEACGNPP